MRHRQINESLDWIVAGKDKEEKITRAKTIFVEDVTLPQFLKMAVDPVERINGIPEGLPPNYKGEFDMPDGISDTTARQEFRRIKNFLPGGPTEGLTKARREALWTNLMEGMHWKEARVLTNIKDQTLFEIYPDLAEILPAVGFTVINKEVKKEKKSRISKLVKEIL
jgi:hypothetical protein